VEARRCGTVTPVYVHEVHTEISGSPAPPVAADRHEPAAVVEEASVRIRRQAWLAGRVASEGFDD
jgi:hypothetical protein